MNSNYNLADVCPIQLMFNHDEPHPPVSHTVTLAGGGKMDVCRDCAESLALGEVLSTFNAKDSE